MHIAGLVVRTRPERAAQVRARLESTPGVEIHAVTTDGRLVVTVEGGNRKEVADTIYALHAFENVLTAAMVYEQSDSDSMNEETS